MPKPVLLLQNESAERLLAGALADRFSFLCPWRAPDPEAALAAGARDVVALLGTQVDAALLGRLPNLQLIVAPGAGYESIDVATARARGIRVVNAGDTHSGDVADHAVALILAAVHRLPEAQDWVHQDRWQSAGPPPRRRAMAAQRFGLVGLGNIGSAIARRLEVFGGEIAWWSRSTRDATWPRKPSLLALAEWCTVLVIATRGDAAGLVDSGVIAAVGPDGLIVNISRGAVLDEAALLAALRDGRLGGAALDVFAREPTSGATWRALPNVVVTPHIAGVSHESSMHLRDAAIRNLLTVLDGGEPVHEITA